MSTARIVSLVVCGVAFIAAIAMAVQRQSISTIAYVGGQFVFDEAAAQRASTLTLMAFISGLIGVGAIIVFAALTARDRKAAEAASA